MKTPDIKDLIVNVLGRQQLTNDQLLAQLCTDERIREIKLGKPRFLSILRDMLITGRLERHTEDNVTRISAVFDAYSAEFGGTAWHVVKYDEGRFNGTILGQNFIEQEARICADALNAVARKSRG